MQHLRSPSEPKLRKRMLMRSRKKVQLLLTKSTLVIAEVFSLPNVVRVLASEASSVPLAATLKTPRSVWPAEKQGTHVLSVNSEITHVILAVKLVTSRRHAKGNLYNLSSGQQGIEIPFWTEQNLSSNGIRHWCRRLSYFRRNSQETLQWHTPHAVQYSPTCIHRTPTQGTRATYGTPKVPRPERQCPTSCCWRLRPIPFWKRLAVPNKTRLDEDLKYSRIGDRPPTGRGFPAAHNYPESP